MSQEISPRRALSVPSAGLNSNSGAAAPEDIHHSPTTRPTTTYLDPLLREAVVTFEFPDTPRLSAAEAQSLRERTSRLFPGLVPIPSFPSESSQGTSISAQSLSSRERERENERGRSRGRNREREGTTRRGSRSRWFSNFSLCFPRRRAPSPSPSSSPPGGPHTPPISTVAAESEGITDLRILRRQLAFSGNSNRISFVFPRGGRGGNRGEMGGEQGEENPPFSPPFNVPAPFWGVNGGLVGGPGGNFGGSSGGNGGGLGGAGEVDSRSVWSTETEGDNVSNGSLSSLRVNVPWAEAFPRPDGELDEASRAFRNNIRQLAGNHEMEALHALLLPDWRVSPQYRPDSAPFHPQFHPGPGGFLPRGPRSRPLWSLGLDEEWTYEELLELDKDNVLIGLRPKEFNQLEKKRQLAEDAGFECRICIEETGENDLLTTLPCRHSFHDECIKPWLTSHRTCPVCRTEIPRCNSEGK